MSTHLIRFHELKAEARPFAEAEIARRAKAGEHHSDPAAWVRNLAAAMAQTALSRGLSVHDVAVSHGMAEAPARRLAA